MLALTNCSVRKSVQPPVARTQSNGFGVVQTFLEILIYTCIGAIILLGQNSVVQIINIDQRKIFLSHKGKHLITTPPGSKLS